MLHHALLTSWNLFQGLCHFLSSSAFEWWVSTRRFNMHMEKCNFCLGPIYPRHSMMFVCNNCKVLRFCKSKHHKNFKKKHNPRKFRWTKAFCKAAGKEPTVADAFEFEKTKNEPIKYQWELWNKTIDVMKTVEEIKQKWQAKLIINRLKKIKYRKFRTSKKLSETFISSRPILQAKESSRKQSGAEITTGRGHGSCFWKSYCL